ncbi:hypothetical protein HY415_02225 [Candidatus Kaiserbacteria bacterium]|nr:hypothetical protein [Candidatus Kaiserbacteria bacterium]
MAGMHIPGQGEWWRAQKDTPPEFHPDPNKMEDPIEKLIERRGPSGAFDELVNQLPPDTNPEVVRQMRFILNKVMRGSQH